MIVFNRIACTEEELLARAKCPHKKKSSSLKNFISTLHVLSKSLRITMVPSFNQYLTKYGTSTTALGCPLIVKRIKLKPTRVYSRNIRSTNPLDTNVTTKGTRPYVLHSCGIRSFHVSRTSIKNYTIIDFATLAKKLVN